MKIVLSYRRADTAGLAGRIFDRLVNRFGTASVFMDIDSIPLGTDFRDYIQKELGQSDIVLVVMGRQWLGTGDPRRIDDEHDYVRIEVETALQQQIPVVPVLVDGAQMPSPADLPVSIRSLTFRNAAQIDAGRDFHIHVDRLIRSIEQLVAKPSNEVTRNSPAQILATVIQAGAKVINNLASRTPQRIGEALWKANGNKTSNAAGRISFPWKTALIGSVWLVCLFVALRMLGSGKANETAVLLTNMHSHDPVEIRRRFIPHAPPPPPPQ
jgi:hypothetical protein